nr:hypothetical protein [Tanacetum cinerariifolium]
MVAILEKTERNNDFHQIVDFFDSSHIRVETTYGETKIIAQVNDRQRTISESSIRRHLKLNDKEDETTFPTRDVRYKEDFSTNTSLDTGQDKENIAKTSAIPHEALPRVTSLSCGAANILANKGLRSVFTTASSSVATASTYISPVVATASESFPTAANFTTDSVATPTTRDKGNGKMTEPKQPSKEKVLEQLSVQLARDLESKFTQEDLIIREQAKRDTEIAMIHAEKELKMMIAELDRSNQMVVKYLSEYEQADVGLSHNEKVELINELLMYQRHIAQIKKYQAQQNKPATKTERRNFYMLILRRNAGWKAKDFKGMTFKWIEEKFIPVWEKMQDFVPINSKLESERLKRPGILLDKERIKKL